MQTPDHFMMSFAKLKSVGASELEQLNILIGENVALKAGDRVFFLVGIEEFTGTVSRDWRPVQQGELPPPVRVVLDCGLDSPITLHRSLFRAFTVLDYIAQI